MVSERPDDDSDNGKRDIPDALQLECYEGPGVGTLYAKPGVTLTVGRTRISKIWIKDPSVSEKHAKFEWSGQCWTIADVGSSNGTRVNGAWLDPEGAPLDLKDGDAIQFGEDSKLKVQITPIPAESVTVEQFLRAECTRYEKHVAAKLEQLSSRLRDEWRLAKRQILREAASVP